MIPLAPRFGQKCKHGDKPIICHQDADNEIKVIKTKNFYATFGKSKNRFDVTKMGTLGADLFSKGLIYN